MHRRRHPASRKVLSAAKLEEVEGWRRSGIAAVVCAALLWTVVPRLVAQDGPAVWAVDAPPVLASVAERIQGMDRQPLADALRRAGLNFPAEIHITLIPDADARARGIPTWIAGLAFGGRDIVIFPERIDSSEASFPYDSLESVVWHEVVHLALDVQAGDRPLPRWFHEGVAMSVERGWGLTSQVQLLLAAADNRDISDLTRLFQSDARPETASAYLLAAALIADVRARHGQAVPGAIVNDVARGTPFADAFLGAAGETADAAAARAWQAYRRWTSWIPIITSSSSVWIVIMGLAAMAFVVRQRRRARRRLQWDQEEAALRRASEPPSSPFQE